MTQATSKFSSKITITETAIKNIIDALKEFIKSENFYGVFTPGLFYEFCSNSSSFNFINKDYKYTNDIDFEEICKKYSINYRKSKPVETGSRSAKETALELLRIGRLWKENESGIDLTRFLANSLNKSLSVVNSELNRSIGRNNLKFLLSQNFKESEEVPRLSREDLKFYFTYLRENSFTTMRQFKNSLLTAIEGANISDYTFQHRKISRSGWIYGFIIKDVKSCQLIKCGYTERKFGERLDEHTLNSIFPENSWAYVFKSVEIEHDEKLLIGLLTSVGKKEPGTDECFWIESNFHDLWIDFIKRIQQK